MPHSIESQRPIMAPSVTTSSNRNSKRFSTISGISSNTTVSTITGEKIQDMKHLATGLDRLESSRLQQQRYIPSNEKRDYLSKVALGAKLERALDRRMANQDAVYKPRTKIISEKVAA